MSRRLRWAFIRVRPVAQTIAAIATTIAAIVRVLKALGF